MLRTVGIADTYVKVQLCAFLFVTKHAYTIQVLNYSEVNQLKK